MSTSIQCRVWPVPGVGSNNRHGEVRGSKAGYICLRLNLKRVHLAAESDLEWGPPISFWTRTILTKMETKARIKTGKVYQRRTTTHLAFPLLRYPAAARPPNYLKTAFHPSPGKKKYVLLWFSLWQCLFVSKNFKLRSSTSTITTTANFQTVFFYCGSVLCTELPPNQCQTIVNVTLNSKFKTKTAQKYIYSAISLQRALFSLLFIL